LSRIKYRIHPPARWPEDVNLVFMVKVTGEIAIHLPVNGADCRTYYLEAGKDVCEGRILGQVQVNFAARIFWQQFPE